MPESVGTNKTFNLPVDELIELALESFDIDTISGKDAKHARTALNLVLTDLQNNDIVPLSSMEITTVALVSGSSQAYPISSDSLALINAVIETSTSGGATDIPLMRINYEDWLNISNKDLKGRPSQFMVDRQRDQLKINVWPVPDANNYTVKAWALKAMADVDASYQLLDIPKNYLPAILEGLRFYWAKLKPSTVTPDQFMLMKQEYYETLERAMSFDRERVSFDVYPELPRVL